MGNIDLSIDALRKHIGLNEIDNWDYPTRMSIRQTLENVLIILNSEKVYNTYAEDICQSQEI